MELGLWGHRGWIWGYGATKGTGDGVWATEDTRATEGTGTTEDASGATMDGVLGTRDGVWAPRAVGATGDGVGAPWAVGAGVRVGHSSRASPGAAGPSL